MFPNVRLIIVAMLASMASICCCLGVFAAFRVNHEPFAQLASGNPPLQLAFGNMVPARATDAVAPFGVRFQLDAPRSDATTPISAQEVRSPDAAKTDGAAVAVETPADQSPPPDQSAHKTNAAPAAGAAGAPASAEPDATAARKAQSRQRVAAKIRHLRRARAHAASQATDQSSTFAQPSFQTFPDGVQSQPVKSRRAAKISTIHSTSQ